MRARLVLSLFACLIGITAAGCGGNPGSPSPTSSSTGGSGTAVTIPLSSDRVYGAGDPMFSPASLTVAAGTTVTWQNKDTIAHTSTSNNGVFNGSLAPGGSYSYTFGAKGTYQYHCTIHPGMTGSVTVQ